MKKKAFTLIELLAVIIVLAVVALIATPLVLDVVEEARDEANKETAYGIIQAGKNYYAESMFDSSKAEKIKNYENIYDEVTLSGKVPESGELYVDDQGRVAISVVIGDKAYVKTFKDELVVNEKENNDIGFIGKDETLPTVDINSNIDFSVSVDKWITETPNVSIKIKDTESGVENFKWCLGIDCEPNNLVESDTLDIEIEDTNGTQLCIIAQDNYNNTSEKVCTETFKVDTTLPEFTGELKDINIQLNQEMDLKDGIEVKDVTSGIDGEYEIIEEPKFDSSKAGTYKVTYKAIDNAGNVSEVIRYITVEGDVPEVSYSIEEGIINESGWANKDFTVTINVKDNSGHGIKEFRLCTATTDRCEPSTGSVITGSTGVREIVTESNNNRICVQALDNYGQESDVICSSAYKLDKTKPTAGTIEITGTKGENDWYTTNVEITKVDGSDGLSGHLETTVDKNSITENTEGEKVTVTTTDLAGNTSTREYTIKVDKTTPTATISKSVSNNKNVLTAVVTPADTLSGYVYEWYKDGSKIPNATGLSYETTESGTYQFKVKTGSGKVVDSNEITIDGYTITYNLNGGTGSISSTTKIQDLSTNITSTIPTRPGYEFLGWGTSSTDKEIDYSSNATYTANESKTLYAIWKKTVTVTFVGNGASIDKTSATCDMYNADTNCTITFPTITREGFTITGFNTDSNATTAQVLSGKTAAVSTNTTYYAITSKVVTVTFNKNGATAIGSTEQKCTIQNSATTCNITSPSITASSATPTVVGWDATSSYTSNEWAVNTPKAFSSNATYYAVTKKDAVTHSITYAKGTGVSAIGATSGSCNIAETYNGNSQSASCNITLPTITLATGYGSAGWYNASGTKLGNASASITVSSSQTITAKATQITCSAGYYLAANATSCTKCEANSYCSGGTYTFASSVQGKSTCPSGYGTSAAGSDAASDCYKTITVTYAGNGSTSGSTSSSSCNAYYNNGSCQITLRTSGFSKTNYTFQGWGTTTSSVSHNANTAYSFSSNTTLNAIWKASYKCAEGTLTADATKGASSGGYICVKWASSSENTTCVLYSESEAVYGSEDRYCSKNNGLCGMQAGSAQEGYIYYWDCSGLGESSECASDEYYITKTYIVPKCLEYETSGYTYYCPSGWSEYSGSNSSLKCYQAATQ